MRLFEAFLQGLPQGLCKTVQLRLDLVKVKTHLWNRGVVTGVIVIVIVIVITIILGAFWVAIVGKVAFALYLVKQCLHSWVVSWSFATAVLDGSNGKRSKHTNWITPTKASLYGLNVKRTNN